MKKTRDYVETLIRDELYKMTSKTFMELWNCVYAGGNTNANYIHSTKEFSSVIGDSELTPMDVVILTQNNRFNLEEDYFILDTSTLTITTFIHQSELEEKIIAPFVKYLYSLDIDTYGYILHNNYPKGIEGLVKVIQENEQKTFRNVAETLFGENSTIFKYCPRMLVYGDCNCNVVNCTENCNKCIENFWNTPYEE